MTNDQGRKPERGRSASPKLAKPPLLASIATRLVPDLIRRLLIEHHVIVRTCGR